MCLCGFVGAGLLIGVPKADAQSNDVLNRIKRIENDVDTLNRAVYKGQKPPALSSGGSDAAGDLSVRVGQIENDLRNLTGKVEQQSYDNQQLQQKLDALTQDTRMRLDTLEGQMRGGAAGGGMAAPPSQMPGLTGGAMPDTNTIPPTAPDGSPAMVPPLGGGDDGNITGDETGAAATDAASLYEQGFTQIKREDYTAAEATFTDFMKKYPKHALAPNALYWLGETFYVRKDYDKASRTFAEAYQKFPGGPKGADNLLKLGLSLAGKGEKENACIALGQLRKEYPKGPEPVLKRGESEMATLDCP